MRNITKDKIIRKPFLDHSIQLCNVNNTDLLSLLTGVNDKINENMINMGDNVPSFKNKVNGIIDEWPYEVTYEDLFKNNNMNPVKKKKGSAIFLHVAKKNYKKTEGCVAIRKKDLINILERIKKNTKIKISDRR